MKQLLQNDSSSVFATLNNWDSNFFYDNTTLIMVLYSIDFTVILMCLFLGIWKLYILGVNTQLGLRIAPVCICIEIVNSLVRLSRCIIYIIKDSSSNYYDLEGIGGSLTCFGIALNLSSGIFIIFFWMNLISKKIYRGNLLEKAFWPSFILVGVVFTGIFVFGILNILGTETGFLYPEIAIILVIFLILAIFYFIIAHKVFHYTKQRSGSKGLNRIAIKIVLSGVCFLMLILFGILHFIFYDPNILADCFAQLGLNLSLSIRSLLQIDVFGTIKNKKTRSC